MEEWRAVPGYEGLYEVSDRVGCHYSNVSLILRGKTWAR